MGFRFHLILLSMTLLHPKTVFYLLPESVHFPLKRYMVRIMTIRFFRALFQLFFFETDCQPPSYYVTNLSVRTAA